MASKTRGWTVLVLVALLSTACGSDAGEKLWQAFLPIWISPETDPDPKLGPTGATHAVSGAAYLGSAAHLAGAADTDWRTDAELHNPGNEPVTVSVELLRHGVDNSSPDRFELLIPPRSSVRLADVLFDRFGLEDKAALRVRSDAGVVAATDRTYNLLGAGNGLGLPAGSTFGQYIPLRTDEDAVGHGEEVRLIGLTHDDRARTNLGLVNTSPIPVEVRVELFLGDGTRLGALLVDMAPYEYRQITRIFERRTSDPVSDGYLVVTTLTDGGRVLVQASVVDAVTGDPVFVPAERVSRPVGASGRELFVAAAAHVAGVAGTNWRTDLALHNPGAADVVATLELLRPNRDNRSPRSVDVTIAPGASVRIEDVLWDRFEYDGAAALRIVADGALLASSRTYNLLLEDDPGGLPAGATFGQFIPAVTAGAAVDGTCEGRMVHLAHDPSSVEGFRTNLVLLNTTDEPTEARIDLYLADGTPLGGVRQPLRPREFRQLNAVFERVTHDVVTDGYAVVSTEGAVLALASVVDNLTGDPVGMTAAITRSPGAGGVVNGIDGMMGALGQAGVDQPVSLSEIADGFVRVGVSGLVDRIVEEFPAGVADPRADGVELDFGDGTLHDGATLAGRVDLDLSGVVVGAGGLHGRFVETLADFEIDGSAVEPDRMTFDVDLTRDGDGFVFGTIGISGGPVYERSSTTVSGAVEIDTRICLYYPVGGELTYSMPDGEEITIRFGPDCDGSYELGVEPAWDFVYRYGHPGSVQGRRFLDRVENAIVVHQGADFWIPEHGGTEFGGRNAPGDTPAGIVTYRFQFDRPVRAAHLRSDSPTFHFTYSRGHTYLLGSTDGTSWIVLDDVPPPAAPGDPPNAGIFDEPLPVALLGSRDLWLRVELYSWGPNANASTNTAQHSRFWDQQPRDRFVLEVDCEDGRCGDGLGG